MKENKTYQHDDVGGYDSTNTSTHGAQSHCAVPIRRKPQVCSVSSVTQTKHALVIFLLC